MGDNNISYSRWVWFDFNGVFFCGLLCVVVFVVEVIVFSELIWEE